MDASIQNPNLQKVDVAALPPEADTLCVRFTLRILSGVGEPSACNNADYKEKLLGTVGQYKEKYGFKELAYRYAYNIANGRFFVAQPFGRGGCGGARGQDRKGRDNPHRHLCLAGFFFAGFFHSGMTPSRPWPQ